MVYLKFYCRRTRVFLHPPAIRLAREALYKLANLENWQVMITTHSPIFIDVSKPHTTITRVEKIG